MKCRISRFKDGGSFQLLPLVMTCRLKILRRTNSNQSDPTVKTNGIRICN